MSEDLVQLVEAAAREVAERDGLQLPDDFGVESPLFGRRGIFDSLGLVGLIVAVEEAIADRYGHPVSLADERALSQSRSPFRTVGSLANYALGLIGESDG